MKGRERRNSLNPEEAQQFIDNIQVVDGGTLVTNVGLMKEIIMSEIKGRNSSLCIVLMSDMLSFPNCWSKLYITVDHSVKVTKHDDSLNA